MLQQSEPSDYVVSTGETHSVREFCEVAFGHVGLDYQEFVVRTTGTSAGRGRSSRGGRDQGPYGAGWKPKTSFADLVTTMVDADLDQVATQAAHDDVTPAPLPR